jgi:hypothetical protein
VIKIGIRDFQVIERLSLPLEGIVAITGPSNNGKTSVARALEACLYNWTGDHFINDKGADECLVGISFPESKYRPPVDVLWKKPRTGGAQYTLNGEEYTKAGRSVLPELMNEGFSVLETPRAKFPLHFWKQMEIFLVNESPSTVFDVLSRLLEDRKLMPVLKSLKDMITGGQKDAQKLEGQAQLLSETQTALGVEVKKYRAFSDFEPRILRVRFVRNSLQKLLDLQDQRHSLIQNLEDKDQEIRNTCTPFSVATQSLDLATNKLCTLERAEDWMMKRTNLMEIEMKRRKLQSTASIFNRIENMHPQRLLTFEEQAARLTKTRATLRSVSSEQEKCEQASEIADKLSAFEERIARINALSDTLDQLESLRSRFEEIEAAREEAEGENTAVEEMFQEFKVEAEVCPKCGGLGFLGGDHVHD